LEPLPLLILLNSVKERNNIMNKKLTTYLNYDIVFLGAKAAALYNADELSKAKS
jgi:hypothetical protein